MSCQHPAGNAGTTCRASGGECDPAETCNGASTSCPADARSPAGTGCTSDGNPCTLDQCDGSSVSCQHPAGNAGTTCRASGGECDPAETCDGVSSVCPVDRKSTALCRPAAGACDVAESCNGVSNDCPPDAVAPGGTVCGLPADQCDAVDSCDGVNKTCPDRKAPSGTPCEDGDICTFGDSCDGNGTCQPGSGDICVVGKVTGGGQVVPNAGGIASFGFVAERQTLAGPTTGHFNYLNHSTGLHVNGPVTLLIVDSPTTATFQGSGTCNLTPCTFVVSVEDGGEPGRNRDKLQVSIAPNSPVEVGPPKKAISRGNIQVHKSPSGAQSEMAVTGAADGIFPAGALYEGVFLDGATFGLGATIANAETAAEGQFQTTLTGVSALGLKRLIQMEGIASSGSSGPADTATFSGTCSVDMGDGTPPLLDVPFTVVVLTNTDGKGSLTLTLGTIDLPAAAINEGSIKIE